MIIRLADTPADRQTCYDLRRLVFMGEQGVSEAEEFDGLDDGAIHLLASKGAVGIATLRLRIVGPMGKIERVCVAPEWRGMGVARALMEDALERLAAMPDLREAMLSAQTYVIPFYAAMGFVAEGPVYDDAGIPHRDMRRAL